MRRSGNGEKRLWKKAVPLVGVVFGMLGMAYAAVPFYDWFCRVTGFAGTTQVAAAGTDVEVLDQTVTVRFDGSTNRGMPWEFRPATPPMEIRIGETGLAFYEAHNPTDHPITGTATFNVTPFAAGAYFTKIDCFCFTEQTLQPGERVMMPVTFYVDPDILQDPETDRVHTITLSYTFYETETEPEQQARLDTEPGGAAASAGRN
ncbi:cytochrome c oxidase assembly protein [Limibaculum sp. M0105]|uniref:Cytochrome c oxidase assembly protein CtaG n=1 Tax=Thermohalobaculum xanthum TaxID=2753746 RepID=A0A8J7SAF0_9RHOB|nr:cytochrome c oxidase assembly protein [Thermohalobaculum xanthum]MBK0397918.1 cytochrome c oxidase assembly protein [Thermohalobaculum xanthum]